MLMPTDIEDSVQATERTTFSVVVTLDDKEYTALFQRYLQPTDAVRSFVYKDFATPREHRSVEYKEGGKELYLINVRHLEPRDDYAFSVTADRQIRAVAVAFSQTPYPKSGPWEDISDYAGTQFERRPLLMLQHLVATMYSMAGGVRRGHVDLIDRHMIQINNGSWRRSKMLTYKGVVAVDEFLDTVFRLGDLARAAPVEDYRARHESELQNFCHPDDHAVGQYMRNDIPVYPAHDFHDSFFQLPDHMQPNMQHVVWYGSRHAPVLLALPIPSSPRGEQCSRHLNCLSAEDALRTVEDYLRHHRGVTCTAALVPLYPQDCPDAPPLEPLPYVERDPSAYGEGSALARRRMQRSPGGPTWRRDRPAWYSHAAATPASSTQSTSPRSQPSSIQFSSPLPSSPTPSHVSSVSSPIVSASGAAGGPAKFIPPHRRKAL